MNTPPPCNTCKHLYKDLECGLIDCWKGHKIPVPKNKICKDYEHYKSQLKKGEIK